MRIWLLTSELPNGDAIVGTARYIDNFARALGATGHEVTIIAPNEEARSEQLATNVLFRGFVPASRQLNEVYLTGESDAHPAYPYNILSYRPALSYQAASETLKLLDDLDPPDIIETQEYDGLAYYLFQHKLLERSALGSIPILVHLHGPSFEVMRANQVPRYRFPDYWVGQMEKFCIVAADALLTPSRFLGDSIHETLELQGEIPVIPWPLFVEGDSPSASLPSKTIACAGRWEFRMGILLLVKACCRLWARGIDFQLALIGEDAHYHPRGMSMGGFIKQRYAPWIESEHLKLVERANPAETRAYMQQAWAVVVPSLWDGFSTVCAEAMNLGQVVLASQSGGQAEMIETDREDGFIFDWSVPESFEQKLVQVLSLGDEDRASIGQNTRSRVRALCSPDVVISQRLRHYEEVVARCQSRHLFPTVQPDMGLPLTRSDEEQPGLLSVIVPFYNLGPFLEETLTSVLDSMYRPLEIIVVDDGSTDRDSLTVLERIENRGIKNLRVLHTENRGPASARNTGVLTARGEFIAFVDADDLVEPVFFQKAIDVLRRYPNVTFVYSWSRRFGERSGIWPTWNTEFPYLLGHNMLLVLAVIRRSQFLANAQHKPELENPFEDFESWISLVEAGGIGVSLPIPLVRRRARADSTYHLARMEQFLYLYDLITRYHPEVYRRWGVELFNLQNANGPGWAWRNPTERTPITRQEVLDRLSGEQVSRGLSWRRLIQALCFKVAGLPGLGWLYHFRSLAERILGG